MEAAQQEDLQTLGQLLQERLQSDTPYGDALKIRCAASEDGSLVVLSQHPPEVNVDPAKTFAALQQALESLRPQVEQPVKLYLRLAGQKQTYTKHYFTLQPSEFVATNDLLSPVDLNDLKEQAPEVTSVSSERSLQVQDSEAYSSSSPATSNFDVETGSTPEIIDSSPTTDSLTDLQPSLTSPEIVDKGSTTEEVIDPTPTTDSPTNLQFRIPSPDVETESTTEEVIDFTPTVHPTDLQPGLASAEIVDRTAHPAQIYSSTTRDIPKRKRYDTLSLLLVVAGGVALAAIFTSVYMLTRPCVIDSCRPLQTAKQLSQTATKMAKSADSQPELLAAQQQLVAANNSLKQIPRWSGRYQEAQQLSQSLFNQSALLNQGIAALQQAARAEQRSKNPSPSLQEWQTIQALWQDAIANLAAVSNDSVLSPLARQKLPAYQTNLKSVNQQLEREQQASKKVTQAKNTAVLAQQRQNTAQSWQTWQTAKATWQTAINSLTTVPKTSTAYREAQRLLPTYQTALAAASDRAAKEQTAAKAFSQALSFADLAEREQQQNQFTNAVNNWKQALTYAQQVPKDTLYYKQVQPLIASYSDAFEQAQAQLKVANVLQKARADLNRTCTSNIRVCTYTVNNESIIVQLTSGYEQAAERSYVAAKRQGDLSIQTGIAFHYRNLRQALEVISANADVPLQIYEADGSLVHTYKPS